MSSADREAGFLQVWDRIKPTDVELMGITTLALKSLTHDAYVTGWLDAELHQQDNSNEEGFSNARAFTQG